MALTNHIKQFIVMIRDSYQCLLHHLELLIESQCSICLFSKYIIGNGYSDSVSFWKRGWEARLKFIGDFELHGGWENINLITDSIRSI